MNKKTKIWFFVASSLVLVGCIIFGGVMTMFKWDFTKLSTNKFETNKYEINDNFKDIKITTNTPDIEFVYFEDSHGRVVCNEQKNLKHSVIVKDNTLLIDVVDSRKWYEYIGINFKSPKITIYLPEGEYGKLSIKSNTGDINIPKKFKFKSIDVLLSTGNIMNNASVRDNIKIKTTTGNILIENISANILDLSTSTGKVDIENVNCHSDINVKVSTGKTNIVNTNCKNIISRGSTGNIYLDNVIATEKLSIKRDTGRVKFKDCDAKEIYVNTNTGDVQGNLLTNKVFFIQSDTGKIDVPKTISEEKCEIITDTGDIKITID
ncbi:MAG: DUF4097 domain-containing protein [Firmicutes bacterium]|nr:DUF4097 domain-containing protein [Bacillota bacterium]